MSDLRFDIQVAEGLSFDELPILMEPLIPEHSMLHLPYEDRLGECYHLSSEWVSLVGREFPDHVRLVHGSIQGFGNPRINHAWTTITDGQRVVCFDPVSRIANYALPWMEQHDAIPRAIYTFQEALAHYGPWDID